MFMDVRFAGTEERHHSTFSRIRISNSVFFSAISSWHCSSFLLQTEARTIEWFLPASLGESSATFGLAALGVDSLSTSSRSLAALLAARPAAPLERERELLEDDDRDTAC
jgi:hypothetical protein